MSRSTKRFVFLESIFFILLLHMCMVQLVVFVMEHIGHKALLMGYSVRLELTSVCSLNDFQLVIGLYRGHPPFFFECVYLSLL